MQTASERQILRAEFSQEDITAETKLKESTSFLDIAHDSGGHDRQAIYPRGHDERTKTGWDRSYVMLLLHSLVLTAVGTMFAVFATGVVPIDWYLSNWGAAHPAVVNVMVTVIATITTAHAKYVIQSVVCKLPNVYLEKGFTLNQLEWMQGVKEWSLFAGFPVRMRPFWLLLYGAMALHSASVVAIMQPVPFVKNVHFPDTAPCGVLPANLTLEPMSSLPPSDQVLLDQSAYAIGLELGTYYQAIEWNTTTTAFGRPYVKENVSYGAVGGLHDGLQNVSGVLFDVQCVSDTNGSNVLWARTFPNRSFPLVNITRADSTSISGSFGDTPVNEPSLQSASSATAFNLSDSEMALYSLVNAHGGGGILGISAENTVTCTWLAFPKLVNVILVNWVARSYGIQDIATFPEYMGRGVMMTTRGMAQAALLGARLDRDRNNAAFVSIFGTQHLPSTAEMLAVMLADGVRSTLAGLTAIMTNEIEPTISMCPASVRTISPHWRFGNAHQFGWIAILVTLGAGISGVFVVWGLSRVRRVKDVEPLKLAHTFMLALDSDIPKLPVEELQQIVLRVDGDRIVANMQAHNIP